MRKKLPENELCIYLMEPVQHFMWERVESPAQTQRGRSALIELRRRIREQIQAGSVCLAGNAVYCQQWHKYLYHLYEDQKAMWAGCYGLACHELEDAIHAGGGVSAQVLSNLLPTLEADPNLAGMAAMGNLR